MAFAKLSLRFVHKTFASLAAATVLMTSAQSFALAQAAAPTDLVDYEQDGTLSQQLKMPLYKWSAPQVPQKGIVLAVHGVAMHGKSYDHLGRTLALQGFLVYALDLHGYGRCIDESKAMDDEIKSKSKGKFKCKERNCRHHVDYDKSFDDLAKLARTVRELNPTLPVFGLGESLGGAMVIRLAARNPELCDGLVLSAPAVKRHALIDPYIIVNAGLFMANPRAQLDLMPFVRKYSSDDVRIVEEKENDPLLRRHMSAYELLKSTQTIRKTISYVPKISSDTPVLIIQGGNDRVLRADAVMTLLSKLRSQDQTVKWFSQRGHILLETSYVRPETMDAVVSWLNQHVQSEEMQSKRNRNQDYVAVDINPKWAGYIQRSTFKVQVERD